VRQVAAQHLDPPIDGVNQSCVVGQSMHRADPASPQPARGRCARTECSSRCTSALVARSMSAAAGGAQCVVDAARPLPVVVQSVVCAAPVFGVYSSSLEMSSASQSFLLGRCETLLRGTDISSVSFTRQAANALVLELG
jgi:hypothetical protein